MLISLIGKDCMTGKALAPQESGLIRGGETETNAPHQSTTCLKRGHERTTIYITEIVNNYLLRRHPLLSRIAAKQNYINN